MTRGGPSDDLTTLHVRRMRGGDVASTAWLVDRLTPWLLVQARFRLRGAAASLWSAEDLVHDVWLAALPKIPTLDSRDGRHTPVVLRYLSATLLFRLQDLVEKRIARSVEPAVLDDRVGMWSGVVSHAARHEREARLRDAIAELDPLDRDLIVMRGIEQHDAARIGVILGMTANAVRVRYHRALRKLRARLPDLTDDLGR